MKNTIKKIISVVLAAMMLVSVGVTAFASEGGHYGGDESAWSGTPIGDKVEQERFVHAQNEVWYYGNLKKYADQNGSIVEYTVSTDKLWQYRVLNDGTVAIMDNRTLVENSFFETELVVPSTVDGYTVSRIDAICSEGSPFQGQQGKTVSVVIPDTVTTIGDDAIAGSDIVRIIIPTSVKSINVRMQHGTFNYDIMESDFEIYYCGTEEQWNDIVVFNWFPSEKYCWAVTDFDWLTLMGSSIAAEYCGDYQMIREVHFNVDPSELPPAESLVPEEKPATSNSFFDQLLAGASSIVVTVVSFFKRIGDLIIQIF